MQYLTSGLAEVRASAESVGGATVGYGDDLVSSAVYLSALYAMSVYSDRVWWFQEAGMERKRMEASQVRRQRHLVPRA
eukprot:2193939-Rhodomonas_salina.1